MNNTPQQVTQRYISNLLHYGRNKEFDIISVDQKANVAEDATQVGVYYSVWIVNKTEGKGAYGATLAQATRRCLEKHGVTFR